MKKYLHARTWVLKKQACNINVRCLDYRVLVKCMHDLMVFLCKSVACGESERAEACLRGVRQMNYATVSSVCPRYLRNRSAVPPIDTAIAWLSGDVAPLISVQKEVSMSDLLHCQPRPSARTHG